MEEKSYYVDFSGWVEIKAKDGDDAYDKFNDMIFDLLHHPKEILTSSYEIEGIEVKGGYKNE